MSWHIEISGKKEVGLCSINALMWVRLCMMWVMWVRLWMMRVMWGWPAADGKFSCVAADSDWAAASRVSRLSSPERDNTEHDPSSGLWHAETQRTQDLTLSPVLLSQPVSWYFSSFIQNYFFLQPLPASLYVLAQLAAGQSQLSSCKDRSALACGLHNGEIQFLFCQRDAVTNIYTILEFLKCNWWTNLLLSVVSLATQSSCRSSIRTFLIQVRLRQRSVRYDSVAWSAGIRKITHWALGTDSHLNTQ